MRRFAVLLAATLAFPSVALAQRTEQPQALDPSKLGVSLDRIRRELRQADVEGAAGVLRFDFRVEVFGQAPQIDLLENFSLTGPVPRSAPTHQDVIEFLTPQAFRSPVIPIHSLAAWAGQKLSEKGRKQRCEEQVAEYRLLVMQGINIGAPRCTR